MLIRISIFVATLIIGTYVASLFAMPEFRMQSSSKPIRVTDNAMYYPESGSGPVCPAAGPGVNVLYNGWEPGSAGKAPFLSFVLCNDSDVTFDSAGDRANVFTLVDPERSIASVSAEKIIPGLIQPRSISEFRIYLDENFKKPINVNQFTIQLQLVRPGVRGIINYRSEQFELPNDFHQVSK